MSVSYRLLACDGGAWACVLAAVVVFGSLVSACMMPFVAIAVATAATLSRRRAAATIIAAWVANQSLGYALSGFPLEGYAVAWGIALCAASLGAMMIATQILRGPQVFGPTLVLAFLAAFAGYEGGLLLFAVFAGGTETFTGPIVLRLFTNDLAWFAGLIALQHILARAAPGMFATGLTTRLA